jgi:hypothetical protein
MAVSEFDKRLTAREARQIVQDEADPDISSAKKSLIPHSIAELMATDDGSAFDQRKI